MANRKLWLDFEKYTGSKLPQDIKNILTACGYDSELAITGLRKEDLETIEREVNENKIILENCKKLGKTHKNNHNSNERFVLKPGHKSLILGLPKRFEQFLEAKKNKQRSNAKKKNENELKSKLIKKLKNYMLSFSFNINFAQSDLSEFVFVQDENCYTCRVKCSFCMKFFPCKFTTYWVVNNFETHLKKHVDDARKITELNCDKNMKENRHVVQNSTSDSNPLPPTKTATTTPATAPKTAQESEKETASSNE